jgi:UDP-N-acetylmuramoyl-tripeptide--D-alanyl-D-alanine ligase
MKVSIDSRTIEPGDYFIPIKGPNFDGHDYIEKALEKGGRLLDVDLEEYARKYRKKLSCHVIAVTGSAGKTTVKDMLADVLSKKYNVVKTVENQNNEVGVPLTVLSADEDTDILIVECAIRHPDDMPRLARVVRPTHVVITNIGLSHVVFFKNQKQIAYSKSKIFQPELSWEAENRTGPRAAFLNYNTPCYDVLQKRADATGFNVFPFSSDRKIDESINVCRLVARHFGLSDQEISDGLSRFSSSSHRLKKWSHKDITLIDDTYNANPDGVRFALEYLSTFEGRKILVMGDMKELGTASRDEHARLVDACIESGVSIVFTLGEDSALIDSESFLSLHFDNKASLHGQLLRLLRPSDVVLFKGSRSMKMEDCFDYVQSSY